MSHAVDCATLDEYLAGDLSAADAAALESHLALCSACRAAVDEQLWIDSLLHSPERVLVEPTPIYMLRRLGAAVSHRRRRRGQMVAGTLAAATLVLAISWVTGNWGGMSNRQALSNRQARIEVPSQAEAPARIEPAVFTGSDDSIVVPVASTYPNVTVVSVYPIYESNEAASLKVGDPPSEHSDFNEANNGG
jgi:anti-sigma factor RsiW